LVEALKTYEGTLILVSHDRWFVGALATRIVEIRPDGIRDYPGTYEEYVHFCGDDHLDADQVILKAKREKKDKGKGAAKEAATGTNGQKGKKAQKGPKRSKLNKWKLQERHGKLLAEIEASESRVGEIDEQFGAPTFYQDVAPEDIRLLEEERAGLQGRLQELMAEWEQVEEDLNSLSESR
jgi:ATPase subunit of ABC transporter with duplicated ATPase domains